MPIGILNNIASLAAENQLTITNNNLNNTLLQLSSGSRINSGADDPAGLAIANGLEANISALTQSASNASDGVGALQVADGSLAQVTTLLNRAVTLATESANGTVSSQQRTALDAEYQQIQTEINQIGSNTTFNGTQVFTSNPTSIYVSDGTGNTAQASNFITANVGTLTASGLLGTQASATLAFNGVPTAGTDAVTIGTQTYTFVAALTQATPNQVLVGTGGTAAQNLATTLSNLASAINGGTGAGTTYSNSTVANTETAASVVGDTVNLTATPAGNAIIAGGGTIASTVGAGTVESFLNGATFSGGSTSDLLTQSDAEAALADINTAIATVAETRGQIGAVVNRLNDASNVINNQVQNLTSAENNITAADIPTAVANLTNYSILEQTGISALAQANQQQQLVLKLLQ
ncbi:MAG TPA: flagellin [Terriglobales bacterium]|nr:flagellin [Terriglobales bacterium]